MFLMAFTFPKTGFCQLIPGFKTTGTIRPAVEKVLESYDAHYQPIEGDTLDFTTSHIVFNSTVKPDDSIECTLTKNIEDNNYDYSWEAVMYKSENFKAASRKYTACCQQLKDIIFNAAGETIKMEGDYVEPKGARSFFTTIYYPHTTNEMVSRLRIEITLESNSLEWTLKVLIYDKVHDDKQGSLKQR